MGLKDGPQKKVMQWEGLFFKCGFKRGLDSFSKPFSKIHPQKAINIALFLFVWLAQYHMSGLFVW